MDVHDQNETVSAPLFNLPHDQLCPGNDALQKLMEIQVVGTAMMRASPEWPLRLAAVSVTTESSARLAPAAWARSTAPATRKLGRDVALKDPSGFVRRRS